MKPYAVLVGDERRLSLSLEKRGDVEKTDLSQVQGFRSFLLYFVLSASDFTTRHTAKANFFFAPYHAPCS